MTTQEVKLNKMDLAKFLEEVATIKAKKRTKLYKLTEKANMFLDDYEADEKNTTLAELNENVEKVLADARELQEEVREQIMAIYQGICDEAITRKPPVEKKRKGKTPKKIEDRVEKTKEEPKQETKKETKKVEPKATLFPKEVEIGDDKFIRVDLKTMADVQKAYLDKELYLLSHWGTLNVDFEIEDFDSLGIVDTLQLVNGYDLMSILCVGDKTAIAVSVYNEVNTTLLQSDLNNMEEQKICFYEKVNGEEWIYAN